MLFQCVVHPKGLDPFQAAKAWHLRVQQGMSWLQVRAQVHAVSGARPGQRAVEDAVTRVAAQQHSAEFQRTGAVKAKYANWLDTIAVPCTEASSCRFCQALAQ